MLATSGKPFDSTDHRFEIKWDGIRMIAYRDGNKIWLETRNLKQALPRFPELAELKGLFIDDQIVLDGEVVVFGDDGTPDFDRVRSRNAQKDPAAIARSSCRFPASYVAFDCLYRSGKSLMDLPLSQRIAHLEEAIRPDDRCLILSRGVNEQGKAYFNAVAERGLEGVVGKRLDSRYFPGKRSRDWIKIRHVKTADCVIGGFVPKGRDFLKSLLLGLYHPASGLYYVGHVGTGFTEEENTVLRRGLNRIVTNHSPFTDTPHDVISSAVWVSPRIVCSIEYLTLTGGGRLRHPTFQGVRSDKGPEECLIDQLSPIPSIRSSDHG